MARRPRAVAAAAWQGLGFNQLRDAVYNHTFDVLGGLAAQGTPADVAQIGNEINGGMLWPDGSTDNWNNLAQLLTAGADAAKAVSGSTQVMLHLAEGGNNSQHRWWFDNAVSRGVPFDIIGVSHYIYWHGSLSSLQNNINDLAARYGRPVAVMETAYGFTLAADDSTGWDPTNPSSGNGWENQALFDYNSRALPAIGVFSEF